MGRLAVWLARLKRAFGPHPGPPKLILLIRHGEKTGAKDDVHLNTRGLQRACALPALFTESLPAPDFIFAASATANSNRPVESVTPLAHALGLTVRQQYANKQVSELARELLTNPDYAGKIVLVCWHRGRIPALAARLGVAGRLPAWNQNQFDRVWRIAYTSSDVLFASLPQRLLPGDSAM